MGNIGQEGREQSQGKGSALLTHPSSAPLGRKALLKLQSTRLPESLHSPSQTSLHQQVLGVPPAQGRDTKDKQWSRQLKRRAEDSKGHQGLALDRDLQME